MTTSNPLGLVKFSCSPSRHGDDCEYDVATIPPSADGGWKSAPNGETIGFSVYPSRVCKAQNTCRAYGDFTYFQTFVDVPANVVVTQFTIAFSGMDDGSRVSIFNSQYPNGLVIPGSYVYFGGSGTANLGAYVKSGETNRVVVTQVDDCCSENNLDKATVVLNGQVVNSGCNEHSECDDGNICTQDICNEDGTCSNHVLLCAGGVSCGPTPSAQGSGSQSSSGTGTNSTCTTPGEPTLTLNGPSELTLECGVDAWVDQGAQASDACGPLQVHRFNSGSDAYGPGPNTCAEGTYYVQYLATNSLGQSVNAVRTVHVDDRLPPTLKLKGAAHMAHTCGSSWVDPGVESVDACYGNLAPTVRWTGTVNGWAEGTYTVVYSVTDSGGNSAPPVTRTVEVVDCPW